MATADDALAERTINSPAPTNVPSNSAENGSMIQLAPINIIGVMPDQVPKPNISILKGRSLLLQQSDALGQTLQNLVLAMHHLDLG